MCVHGENEIFVTLPENKNLLILDSHPPEIKQSVSVDLDCYGISTSGNAAVFGARSSVVMFDNFIHEKKSQNNGNRDRVC